MRLIYCLTVTILLLSGCSSMTPSQPTSTRGTASLNPFGDKTRQFGFPVNDDVKLSCESRGTDFGAEVVLNQNRVGTEDWIVIFSFYGSHSSKSVNNLTALFNSTDLLGRFSSSSRDLQLEILDTEGRGKIYGTFNRDEKQKGAFVFKVADAPLILTCIQISY